MNGIVNPKQNASIGSSRESRVFPYYAGYSVQFAESIIDELALPKESLILDPWNGSGTTGVASYKKGHRSIGVDLNPVMVLVSKASFVSKLDLSSLLPLAHSLMNSVDLVPSVWSKEEALEKWFNPQSAACLRKIETLINNMFVSESHYVDLTKPQNLKEVSTIAAFFYVVLFRLTRRFIADFVGTNPTWLKSPKDPASRKNLDAELVKVLFLQEVEALCLRDSFFSSPDAGRINIEMGDAKALDIESNSVDAIITSPPYCTRIDYAVATSLELALLRMSVESFQKLRRSLIGTSTVERETSVPDACWGNNCLNFLEKVRNHPSYASKTYYYKSHVQYYQALYTSVGEASRVCKSGADLVFVVQNSYYKDVLNDLALILEEMGEYFNLKPTKRCVFSNKRSMSDLNVKSKKYVKPHRTEESVIFFKKK